MIRDVVNLIRSRGRGDGIRTQLIRGAMGVGGLNLIALPVGLAASILLARGLGPEGFGRYAFIMSVVTFLSIPIAGGMRLLLTREVAGYDHGREWGLFRGLLRRAHQWVALGLLVIGGGLGALAASRATWDVTDRWTLLLVGLAALPFVALNAVRAGTLRGLGNVVLAQLPEQLASPGLHLTVIAALLIAGRLNPATALMSQALAAAVAFLLGAHLLRRKRPPAVERAVPEYRSGEWGWAWAPFTLLIAASVLNGQIGILLLGWLGTEPQIAALRVAERGAQLVILPLGIVNTVIAPFITRAYRDGDRGRLQELSRQSARAALLLALPIALPMIVLGAAIIGLVFGTDYVELTVTPLAILAVAQLVNVGVGSVGNFLAMSGFEKDTLLGQVVALALNGMAAVFLIPPFGATGAAWAAALGLVTWNVILAVKFAQRLGLRPTAL